MSLIKMEKPEEYTIRQLMPKGFTKILVKKTRRPQPYITKVVKEENTQSPIWPFILELAEETKAKMLEEQKRLEAVKSKAA
jgi:hypothetical protein